ncbi:MAG: caspase family protein [Clostridiales bacterium]|nr:caspase family protein [Clostridiales bacterium]
MNIAIIIGTSEYENSQNNLPGCKKDAESVKRLVDLTDKYSEILYVNKKISSSALKEKFSDFIESQNGKDIDELLFYYSGHGEFVNDEFYYPLYDYSENKRNLNSLKNSEVDIQFKSLSPQLVVKIIDACKSGVRYIKDTQSINKYFDKTQNNFNKCYFMYSSLVNQSSFQTEKISDFTKSLLSSIGNYSGTEIRYIDIMNYIADDFYENPMQTPFFVNQSRLTEKFCTINDKMREIFKFDDIIECDAELPEKTEEKIVNKIKLLAKTYCNKEEAFEILNKIRLKCETYEVPKDFNEFYERELIFKEDYNGIINTKKIGLWLEENHHSYMANAEYGFDFARDPYGALMAAQSVFTGVESNSKKVLKGFDIDIEEPPYKSIVINYNSKYPNVLSHICQIVYLISKTKIALFGVVTNFIEDNWDSRKINKNVDWSLKEIPIKDEEAVLSGVNDYLLDLENLVHEHFEDIIEDE